MDHKKLITVKEVSEERHISYLCAWMAMRYLKPVAIYGRTKVYDASEVTKHLDRLSVGKAQ